MKANHLLFKVFILSFALFMFSCGEDGDDGTTPTEICNNGIDDDADGAIDCDDSDCDASASCQEDCTNGTDDDGDGDIDCDDGDCATNAACIESNCANGTDDDGDGLTDCDDPDCATATGCFEECNNGIDDDGNGDIDCFDAACSGFSEGLFEGTYVGLYVTGNGVIPIPDADTLTIERGGTADDNVMSVTSSLLGFSGSASIIACNLLDLDNGIIIDELSAGALGVFNDITLGDSSIFEIVPTGDTIYMRLFGVTIDTGTVDATLLGGYPIEDANFTSNDDGSVQIP